MRPQLHEALGHVVHARMSMTTLATSIIDDMSNGYMPTYRGYEVSRQTIADLEMAAQLLEGAFHCLKAVQTPTPIARASRMRELERTLSRVLPSSCTHLE